MNKEHRYIPAVISLLAGLVISIVAIVNRIETLKSLILILSFLLGFYILGCIFRAVINKFETKPEEIELEDENVEEDDIESDDSDGDDKIDNEKDN